MLTAHHKKENDFTEGLKNNSVHKGDLNSKNIKNFYFPRPLTDPVAKIFRFGPAPNNSQADGFAYQYRAPLNNNINV